MGEVGFCDILVHVILGVVISFIRHISPFSFRVR